MLLECEMWARLLQYIYTLQSKLVWEGTPEDLQDGKPPLECAVGEKAIQEYMKCKGSEPGLFMGGSKVWRTREAKL